MGLVDVDKKIDGLIEELTQPKDVKYCKNCGQEMISKARFCKMCKNDTFFATKAEYDKSLSKKICTDCGEVLDKDDQFCYMCGGETFLSEVEFEKKKKADEEARKAEAKAEAEAKAKAKAEAERIAEIKANFEIEDGELKKYKGSGGNVVIPNSVTSIGEEAFSDCDSLTNIVIPDSVTSIGESAFSICMSLRSVILPDSVTSIGDYAFGGCDSLTSIEVSENNRYYKSIGGNLYSKDGKTLILYAMGKKDTSFTIPSSVTSIGNDAFCDCKGLTSITIPNSVTSIEEYAFYDCTGLIDVYYTGTKEEWAKITIYSSSIYSSHTPLTNANIHYNYVPEE